MMGRSDYLDRGEYAPAAVCRRGHPVTSDVGLRANIPKGCSTCGAVVLTACTHCDHRIRGRYKAPGIISTGGYQPPDFCDECRLPHPWASRQARIYQLQNILDEQNLDEAARLTVQEQLEALAERDVPEEEQAERWARIKRLAPGFVDAGGRIIEGVVSAAIKAQLGL